MACKICGGILEPSKTKPRKYCKKCAIKVHKKQGIGYTKKWRRNNLHKAREGTKKSVKKWKETHLEEYTENQQRTYYQNKQRALDYKGGCVICGSKENIHYHHLNPDEKYAGVTMLFSSRRWGTIKAELDKCIPICEKEHHSMEAQLRHFKEKLKKGGYIPR